MTPKLGDFFPEPEIDKHARSILTKGAVLRLQSADIWTPKIKRLIVIGCTDQGNNLGKIYINSEPQATHSQLLLESKNRPYLDRDSYADCSRIYEDEYNTVLDAVKHDLGCHIGNLSEEDMESIAKLLRACRTIPQKQKQKFGIT